MLVDNVDYESEWAFGSMMTLGCGSASAEEEIALKIGLTEGWWRGTRSLGPVVAAEARTELVT